MIIPNYKVLCELLEVEVKGGVSKTAQLKELERYCKYEKNGKKFIIQELYEQPLEIVDGRLFSTKVLPYITNMELLLLDFLVYCKGDVTISKSGLYKILSMVNENYSKYSGEKRKKLAIDKSIEYNDVKEFYSVSSKVFNDAILTVLDRLERKRVIFHQKVKMIVRLESEPSVIGIGHKQKITIDEKYNMENIDYVINDKTIYTDQKKEIADDETIRQILIIEKQVLGQMGLLSSTKKNYLHYSSRYEEFVKRVNKLLVEKLNIAWAYDAYKIIFNYKAGVEERDFLLYGSQNLRIDTNNKVINQLKKRLTKGKNVDYFAVIDNLIEEVVKINRK